MYRRVKPRPDRVGALFGGPDNHPSEAIDKAAHHADHPDMEKRIDKLEAFAADARDRLARIETRLDGIDHRMTTSMATKADLASMATTIVKWFIGTAIAISGLAFAAAKFIK